MRVLAVDDDPNDLRYVRDALSAAGYRPVVTGDPEEALRLMEEEQPQVVLLDLMLPDADGVDLMQAILEIADVPVIIVSAYGQEDLVARAFDQGRWTTWSSPSRPRSWRPGSGPPCDGGRFPCRWNPTSVASWRLTSPSAG